jgi:hypothetical protein
MATKSNSLWTADDDKRLMQLKAAGKSCPVIAAALRRSAGSIKSRFGVLNARSGQPDKVIPNELDQP